MAKLIRKTRKVVEGEQAFTLVELLIVMIVSLIMLAGMVGLLEMAFKSFSSGKKLQSLTDASRRVLPAMDRQMKSLLFIDDAYCVANYLEATPPGAWNGISFYSDIDNDDVVDVDSYTNTEKIEFYQNGDKLMQRTTEPGIGGAVTTTSLCSYVESVRFYYFSVGISPGSDNPPANRFTGDTLNDNAGSIKVVIVLKDGNMTKTYEQSTFLRILDRGSS